VGSLNLRRKGLTPKKKKTEKEKPEPHETQSSEKGYFNTNLWFKHTRTIKENKKGGGGKEGDRGKKQVLIRKRQGRSNPKRGGRGEVAKGGGVEG